MTPTQERNARSYIRLVENRLGWAPFNRFSPRSVVISVLKKQDTNPELYTWDNLRVAVELLAREHESRSPLGVFHHVERALKLAREDDSDLEKNIQRALQTERHRGDPDGWVVRFARTTGWYRTEAYKEWQREQAKPR